MAVQGYGIEYMVCGVIGHRCYKPVEHNANNHHSTIVGVWLFVILQLLGVMIMLGTADCFVHVIMFWVSLGAPPARVWHRIGGTSFLWVWRRRAEKTASWLIREGYSQCAPSGTLLQSAAGLQQV